MELTHEKVLIVLILGFLQTTQGFRLPEETENPTKGNLEKISLHHLSSAYLKPYSNVSFLKISNCKIGKIEEDAFDGLPHLNLLEISDSEIGEKIDRQTFAGVQSLEILILKNVGLKTPDLNLTHVQDLTLTHNGIERFEGGAVVGRNLNFLDLSNNKLKALVGSLGNLNKLRMIDISRNKLEKVDHVFDKNLKLLNVLASENLLTSTEGLRLPWLKRLNLFGNKLQSLSSESFTKMSSLEELVLAFNNIKHLDDPFQDLIELKYLNLAWNEIEELKPTLFRRNLYLTELSLQGNRIKSLKSLVNVHHHLTHLDLSHNQLSLISGDFFRSTPSLQVLDLSFNHLKTLANILSPLRELKILNLAYNEVVMSEGDLSQNGQLTHLNLSSNGVEGGLSHFEGNPLLVHLDVSFNKISHFCDGSAMLENLLKLNLKGNRIERLGCLKTLRRTCEVDFRGNPLVCGEELDDVILDLAHRKRSPYKLISEFQHELSSDQCENLSLNRSVTLWNSVKRELCPEGRNIEIEEEEEEEEEETESEEETENFVQKGANPTKKTYVILPVGWLWNDEMSKSNPLETPQSGRMSWGNIEENSELLKGFEDEDTERRPRFSWYTIALILIGLSLTLTCFNLAVFFYIRLKVWKRGDTSSSQKYIFLQNEVYKNTTEPTKEKPRVEAEWTMEKKNKMASTVGKVNDALLNFALRKKDKDPEAARNVLIEPSTNGNGF